MSEKKEYTREELLNMDIMSPKEARNFIKEKLHISDTYYTDCVMPILRPKFKPLLRDFRRKRPAALAILKSDVDDFIANQIKKMLRSGE